MSSKVFVKRQTRPSASTRQTSPSANFVTTVQRTTLAPDALRNGAARQVDASASQSPERAARRGHNFANLPIYFQAKLAIGQPVDPYEQEADRVASQVVDQIHAPVAVQSRPGQALQREAISGAKDAPTEPIQMRREASADMEASPTLAAAINGAKGGGQPLAAHLQRSMGQAMGAEFSRVRVHRDAQADQLNRSLQAKAFTTGQDVFFRQGAYQPESRAGQALIAHELTHVVQQTARPSTIQRHISYNIAGGQFQVDASRPGWVGSVKALAPGANQSRDHIVPFETIQNDLANKLNAFLLNPLLAGAYTPVTDLTEALYRTHLPLADYNRMRQRRLQLYNALVAGQTHKYEYIARRLLASLNSAPDNIRLGNSTINQSIGENLDADFLPGSIAHTGWVENHGQLVYLNAVPVLRLTAPSNDTIWKYQRETTQNMSFVLNLITNTQLSSVTAPTLANLPVLVFKPAALPASPMPAPGSPSPQPIPAGGSYGYLYQ